MQWRRLGYAVDEPARLLDRGAALLDELAAATFPTLRWYRSSTPALVLGRGQPPLLGAVDLPVVTRHSGGGAVLMDRGLLSLDVLLPEGHTWLDGPLTRVFDMVGQTWAKALCELGVDDVVVHDSDVAVSRRGDERERLLAAICYATPGRGEVLVHGRKLVGLAQRRRRVGALVQCGLLRRWNPQPLLAAFGGDPADAEVIRAAVGLDDLVSSPPSDETVMNAVEATLIATE